MSQVIKIKIDNLLCLNCIFSFKAPIIGAFFIQS